MESNHRDGPTGHKNSSFILLIIILSIMHVLTVNVETDINSSYAVPIRPRFIRNTEIDANGHGRDVRRQK